MIPIHDLANKHLEDIRVIKLGEKLHYDASEPHRHNYFELFIFENGSGKHQIDFDDYPVESKTVHIVAPGKVHQMNRGPKSNGFVIHFDTSVIQGDPKISEFLFDQMSYDNEEFSPMYRFDEETGNQMVSIAETIWKDFNSDNDLKTEFVKNHLYLICIQCLRTVQESAPAKSKNQDLYQSFRRLLRNNFREIKKVKEYAAALNISEKQLNEVVNSKSGMSTSQLIYNQIIMEAKRFLKTGISAKETAYELNFDDPGHFSKFFKNQTGVSPSQFQKVHA